MAKPDTPGKRFSDIAAQNYWGAESARKTLTTVLYKGPYIDIGSGVESQVSKYIDNTKASEFNVDGSIINNGAKLYVLHDRTETVKMISRISEATAGSKNRDKYSLGQLRLFSDQLGEDIQKIVNNVYSKRSPDVVSPEMLQNIFLGIYAFKFTYRVNHDVLFNHLPIMIDEKSEDGLSEWNFVINVPTARSKVPGRHDHVELVKAKYLGDGPASKDVTIVGEQENIIKAGTQIGSSASISEQLKIALPAFTEKLERGAASDKFDFNKIREQ